MSTSSAFALLANVETQLCMHGLQATEILALAQCSRRMRALADDAFAWKMQPMLTVHARRDEQSSHHLPSDSCSARHSPPVKLVLGGLFNESLSDAFVELIHRIPNLHVIEAQSLPLPLSAWFRVLSHPCAQQLRSLRLHRHWNCQASFGSDCATCAQLGSVILRLPHLTQLACHSDGPHADCWADAAAAPSLTDLSVRDSPFSGPSAMPFIAKCERLRKLQLDAPAFGGGAFKQFFSHSGMQRLEELTLTRFILFPVPVLNVQPIPVADFPLAFKSLTQLHTLHVHYCTQPDLLLIHVALAPALREVSIRHRVDVIQRLTPRVLAAMLMNKPDLHCTLMLHCKEPSSQNPDSREHLSRDPLHLSFLEAECMQSVLDRFKASTLFFNKAGQLE